jgi:hypothetical protein
MAAIQKETIGSPPQGEQLVNIGAQLCQVKGFEHEAVEPGALEGGQVFGVDVGGQPHDDGARCGLGQGANGAGGFNAVHDRHEHVHKHGMHSVGLYIGQGLGAMGGLNNVGLGPVAGQHFAQQQAVNGVVVYHQKHPRLVGRCHARLGAWGLGAGGLLCISCTTCHELPLN